MNNLNDAGNLLPIRDNNSEATLDSRDFAKEVGNEHRAVLQLLKIHQEAIEKDFGRVAFEMLPFETKGGVQNTRIAHLTEGQAIALATLSKNTKHAVAVKLKIAKSFMFFKQATYKLAGEIKNNWLATALKRNEKRIIAGRLVEKFNLQKKTIAKLLGVTQKTLSQWGKTENWTLQEGDSFVISPIDMPEKIELPKEILHVVVDVTNRTTRKTLLAQLEEFIETLNEQKGGAL